LLLFDQVNGNAGAGQIAPVLEGQLQQNQETLDFLLDEGMFVMQVVVFPSPLSPFLTFVSTALSILFLLRWKSHKYKAIG
jgi:hypothetical protein